MTQIIIPEEYEDDDEVRRAFIIAAFLTILKNRDENDGKR